MNARSKKSGKKPHNPLAFGTFFKEYIKEAFHLDSRLWETVTALLIRPGRLTLSYFGKRRSEYIEPLKLYFAVNFIFFLLIPVFTTPQFKVFGYDMKSFTQDAPHRKNLIMKEIGQSGLPEPVFEERFNATLKYNQPAFVFIMIPLLAFFLKLLYLRQKRFYVEHLTFSMHLYAFFLMSLLLTLMFFRILTIPSKLFPDFGFDPGMLLLILFFAGLLVYSFLAVQRFYQQRWFFVSLKTCVLFAGLWLNLALYSLFIFYYSLFALRFSY